ncbi:hypothetical protein C1645_819427 [Glomus cerebriforme]|uniref:Uncharacterized protein n=1 Tax=Glomus cerebriforme TaxID=658196 RepID=A0A397TER9_9GLOM|nr:hypothetical protein C1645_819427 [Glomus cerebriforme]
MLLYESLRSFPEEAEVLNKGTYLTNLIVPAIRVCLKNLSYKRFTYISTYERQSITSTNRRKCLGRRPDIIFVYKDQRPEKNEFGVIGLQIAKFTLRLTVLIRNEANVDRYYHLYELKVSVQKSETAVVVKFIKTLLILHNILIVNISLLPHRSTSKLDRQKEDNTTVNSE